MNECKPLALGTPSPWVVDWVAAPPRTAPSPRRRALPSGPILGIYASWDNHKQCAERTTRSVLQGVNVIFWFGMGMHVNDTTVGLEATRRLMTCRAAFQWTRSSSSSTRHSCMARYRLFVCSYATRTPDPARWACHSSHRACTRSASSRGLHSSTSQLSLSRFRHKIHPIHLLIPANTCYTPPTQPLDAPRSPQNALKVEPKSGRV